MSHKPCAYPGCTKEGEFPAPKSTKDIYDRQYFCQEHIAEFNKKWNGLDGMSEDDIFAMQTKSTWERPTWTFGIHGESARASQFQFKTSDDLYAFFKNRQKREFLKGFSAQQEAPQEVPLPPDVQESCAIMNITLPITEPVLKKKYLDLIKKHHPDKNAGDKNAEESVKRINVANQILKDYIQNN